MLGLQFNRTWTRPLPHVLVVKQRIQFIDAFAAAIQDAQFIRNPTATLALLSAKGAISHMVTSFWNQGFANPTLTDY